MANRDVSVSGAAALPGLGLEARSQFPWDDETNCDARSRPAPGDGQSSALAALDPGTVPLQHRWMLYLSVPVWIRGAVRAWFVGDSPLTTNAAPTTRRPPRSPVR